MVVEHGLAAMITTARETKLERGREELPSDGGTENKRGGRRRRGEKTEPEEEGCADVGLGPVKASEGIKTA